MSVNIQNMSEDAFLKLTPEEKEARIAEQWATEKVTELLEWRKNNPEKAAECARQAREITAKWLEDRRIMRETNLEAFVAMVKNEAPGSKDPSRHTYLQERTLVANMRREEAIAKKNADFAKAQAEKEAARDAERAAKEAERQAAYAAKLAERNKK
jgi:hypothetical protein